MNIADIEAATDALAQTDYDPDEFALSLFAAYDAPPATITRIRNGSQNATDLDGGFLWKRKMHVLTCPHGGVPAALDQLAGSKATRTHKVQFIVATDGEEFAARDLVADETRFFALGRLGDEFAFFLPAAGYQRFKAAEENPVDVKASAKLKRLYDALADENEGWAEGDDGRHEAHLLMTRLIFCLFAEDTGVFPDDLFARTIAEQGGHDGEEMPRVLKALFAAMAKDGVDRDGLPEWATAFPYVNGGLFAHQVPIPRFSRTAYRVLCDAAALNWKDINPDIFGSMIQTIVDKDQRHETGLHYTSVPNILKCLDPLFLDDLRAEAGRKPLADQSREKKRLKAILRRLSQIRLFDPACGSGNFLVIAYREMRHVEMTVLARLRDLTGETPGVWSHVELDNFYGIEVSDFAAETAKLALWIAKYQMDREYESTFGKVAPALPIQDAGHIVTGNALREDWSKVCPPPVTTRNRKKLLDLMQAAELRGIETVPDHEIKTYIVGNPPYLGYNKQTPDQKADLEHVAGDDVTSWRSLDYIAGWVLKAARMVGPHTSAALVTTNSVCQGEHASILWPAVFGSGTEIGFAHTSFAWKNNAANNAGVTCIVLGLRAPTEAPAFLYDDDQRLEVEIINQYLVAAPPIDVQPARCSPFGLPAMSLGNMPKDGGNLILSPDERSDLLAEYPEAERFVRRFVGSQEAIKGIVRYCLWITDDEVDAVKAISPIAERLEGVRQMRLASRAESTRDYARWPHRFKQIQGVAQKHTIVVPKVQSERRQYLPIDYLTSGEIASDNAFALYDEPTWHLSILSSRLHRLWIETVCGRMKTDIRYGNTLGWHTFPVPELNGAQKDRLTKCAEDILVTRAELGGTLAELYDPDEMPDLLREAHRENDRTLERIYTDRPFRSDADRLNHLFRRYARMIAIEKGEAVPDKPAFNFAEPQTVSA